MGRLRVRKDTAQGVVEVNTGTGWEQLSPRDAREMAELYARVDAKLPPSESRGLSKFVRTLRSYADDVDQ